MYEPCVAQKVMLERLGVQAGKAVAPLGQYSLQQLWTPSGEAFRIRMCSLSNMIPQVIMRKSNLYGKSRPQCPLLSDELAARIPIAKAYT